MTLHSLIHLLEMSHCNLELESQFVLNRLSSWRKAKTGPVHYHSNGPVINATPLDLFGLPISIALDSNGFILAIKFRIFDLNNDVLPSYLIKGILKVALCSN